MQFSFNSTPLTLTLTLFGLVLTVALFELMVDYIFIHYITL